MQLLTFLSICLTLGSTATAAAVAKREDTDTTTTSPSSYLLQTKVVNGGRPDFDGLYVESWHTFAGASDATLSNKGHARRAQLINGTQYFDLGEEWGAPWTFDLPEPSGDAWFPVHLNAGTYSTGFFLNGTGLQWTPDEFFGGWLVCQWSHRVPQLFWKVSYYWDPVLPDCAQVELRATDQGPLFPVKTT